MGFLYEREETDSHTVIRYTRYLPGFALLLAAYAIMWLAFRSSIGVTVVAAAGMFIVIRDQRTVRRLLIEARKEGRVTRSGRAWSISKPLTFTIDKATQRGARPVQKGTQRTKKKRH